MDTTWSICNAGRHNLYQESLFKSWGVTENGQVDLKPQKVIFLLFVSCLLSSFDSQKENYQSKLNISWDRAQLVMPNCLPSQHVKQTLCCCYMLFTVLHTLTSSFLLLAASVATKLIPNITRICIAAFFKLCPRERSSLQLQGHYVLLSSKL